MNKKVLAMLAAGVFAISLAAYAYTTSTAKGECCAGMTEKACGTTTATAEAAMPSAAAAINGEISNLGTDAKACSASKASCSATMTEAEYKACADAHGMTVEECKAKCSAEEKSKAACCKK